MVLKTKIKRIIGAILCYGFILGLCFVTEPQATFWECVAASVFLILGVALIGSFVVLIIWLLFSS